jgi:predicted nucleic acid-binding protein
MPRAARVAAMLIVDASVALKWTVRDVGSDLALGLLSEALAAPDLFQAELGSVLTKKVRRGEISPEQARGAFAETMELVDMLPSPAFAASALDLSLRLVHSIYDCYYLAVAEAYGAFLVTADRLFVTKVRQTDLAPLIFLLGEDLPNG